MIGAPSASACRRIRWTCSSAREWDTCIASPASRELLWRRACCSLKPRVSAASRSPGSSMPSATTPSSPRPRLLRTRRRHDPVPQGPDRLDPKGRISDDHQRHQHDRHEEVESPEVLGVGGRSPATATRSALTPPDPTPPQRDPPSAALLASRGSPTSSQLAANSPSGPTVFRSGGDGRRECSCLRRYARTCSTCILSGGRGAIGGTRVEAFSESSLRHRPSTRSP